MARSPSLPTRPCNHAARRLAPIALLLAGIGADAPGDDGAAFFRARIGPVLEAECVRCHSGDPAVAKGGLVVDAPAGLRAGGDSGPAVVPGAPGESLILQALRHEDGLKMPPKKPPLPEAVVADFARWIEIGAPDPRPATAAESPPDLDQARRHWAFRPVRKPEPPAVGDEEWPRDPMDAFILARLEAEGWQPAPPADRRDWIRRVTFDLTGLPPTPEEVDAFLADDSSRAYETVVDRLLGSPHYGERWAQHWLDVVRFAETEGYEYDRHIPDAWRYRDYVIAALNADMPLDRFVTEQLAGDELAPDDPACRAAATFHRLGPVRRNAGNPEIALSRNEVLTERTDILGSALLGLSIGCARCHDHKLEPIAQRDYYRLQAYLAATAEDDILLLPPDERDAWLAAQAELRDLRARARAASGAERKRLAAEADALEMTLPAGPPTIPSTRNDFDRRTPIHVLKRGDWGRKGEPVGPRPPSVLVPDDLPELPADVPDPRTRLARWLTAPGHPLTARVLVNRAWQGHFGTGLVKTANDFGTKGDRPSHPELLDWLAATFVEEGWRLKPLHRRIVLSSTYRQAGRSPLEAMGRDGDPEDRLLWKFPRRRLSAEEVRDAMLAVSGRLNREVGGPSVMVPVEPDLVALLYKPAQWVVHPDEAQHDRRSIYLLAKRNLRLPFLDAFDAPPGLTSCARRATSTHAPQALELLNGRLANELAAAFAARLEAECGDDPGRVVGRAFALALGRPPTDAERALATAFLRDQPAEEFALAVFNLNGFLYVP